MNFLSKSLAFFLYRLGEVPPWLPHSPVLARSGRNPVPALDAGSDVANGVVPLWLPENIVDPKAVVRGKLCQVCKCRGEKCNGPL